MFNKFINIYNFFFFFFSFCLFLIFKVVYARIIKFLFDYFMKSVCFLYEFIVLSNFAFHVLQI